MAADESGTSVFATLMISSFALLRGAEVSVWGTRCSGNRPRYRKGGQGPICDCRRGGR
jgi:hypothetical protein